MRNLFIKRNKSFVGCVNRLKVYVEDNETGDLKINKVPCRKLGTIKNGEQKTFVIDDQEVKVFVIADKLSKGYCNDFYTVPAGQEDVFLSGKCKYNPLNGNAFRFDGVTDEEALKNRKKGTKIGIIVLVIAFIVGIILGFAAVNREPQPEQFKVEEMCITLTDEFVKIPMENVDGCFGIGDITVMVLREDFNLVEGLEDLTLAEYGDLVIESNGLEDISELMEYEGIICFDYEADNEEGNETYYYFSTVFKSGDAFWTVQFISLAEDADEYLIDFVEWAKTVEFIE